MSTLLARLFARRRPAAAPPPLLPHAPTVTPRQLQAAYAETFGTPAGQVVLAHLLNAHGYLTYSALMAGDPQATAAAVGEQRVVFGILRRIAAVETQIMAQLEAARGFAIEEET